MTIRPAETMPFNWKRLALILLTLGGGVASAAGLKTFLANSPAIAADVNSNFAFVLTPPGSVVAYAGTGAIPTGWLLCDGTGFSSTTYPELAAALGASSVPDLIGRVIVGVDPASARITTGAAASISASGGLDINTAPPAHTHIINSEPNHQHNLRSTCNNSVCSNVNDGFARGSGTVDGTTFKTALGGTHDHGGNTQLTGTTGGTTNLQPYLALRYIIKT